MVEICSIILFCCKRIADIDVCDDMCIYILYVMRTSAVVKIATGVDALLLPFAAIELNWSHKSLLAITICVYFNMTVFEFEIFGDIQQGSNLFSNVGLNTVRP